MKYIGIFGCLLWVTPLLAGRQMPEAQSKIEPADRTQSVSYNELYNKVLEPKCVGCHGASGGVNLETYQGAKLALSQIQEVVLDDKRMPKAPFKSLMDDEFALVEAWVQAGGPDGPLNGDTPPALTPLVPDFASIKTKILIPRCLSCHNPEGPAARVSLETAQAMIESPLEIVIPGNPSESGIILVVQEGSRKPMPPTDSHIRSLKAEEVQTLTDWIANGAL